MSGKLDMFQRKLIQLVERSPTSILSRNSGGEPTASVGLGHTLLLLRLSG